MDEREDSLVLEVYAHVCADVVAYGQRGQLAVPVLIDGVSPVLALLRAANQDDRPATKALGQLGLDGGWAHHLLGNQCQLCSLLELVGLGIKVKSDGLLEMSLLH